MAQVSLHENLGRSHENRASSDRGFGIVFAIFFSLVAFSPLLRRQPVRWWALMVGGGFLIVALAQPAWLRPLNRVWTNLGLLLGRVVNPVVTGLLFYLVVTPTGLFFRLFGKDPLRLSADRTARSYWISRQPPGPAPETMARQF
jgi:hypothetical protein